MKERVVNNVIVRMADVIGRSELLFLRSVLTEVLYDVDVKERETALSTEVAANEEIVKFYITARMVDGLAKSSLCRYKDEIEKFLHYTGVNVLKAEANDIRKYFLHLKARGCSNTTIDGVCKILKVFFRFLLEEGYISTNPCRNIDKVKVEHTIKYTPNDFEVELLRDACESKREVALVDFALSTGLRISEIASVKLTDVDWNRMVVLVHGKGSKDRVVPFSVRCKKHLEDYIVERDIHSEWLITRERNATDGDGNEIDPKPSKAMIGAVLRKIRKRCELSNVTVHSLRRYVAQYLDEKNVDGTIIQELLGHSSFGTTKQSYIGSNQNKMIHTCKLYAM